MTAATGSAPRRSRVLRALARWETLLLVVLLGLIVLGTQLSPVFLTPRNFANLLAALMEVAIMALPMTLVIIAGEIDLSVESMAGLPCAVLGFLWAAGVPIWIGVALVLAHRRAGRAAERPAGRPGRPAVAGRHPRHARPVPRDRADRPGPAAASATSRPNSPRSASATCPGRSIPWPFVIFLALALILGIVLHRTWIGRQVYAVGKSAGAAALLRRARDAPAHRPVHAHRHRRRARRRDPHVAPLDRPRRRRHRA